MTIQQAQAQHRKAIRAALKFPAYSEARRAAIAAADQAYAKFKESIK